MLNFAQQPPSKRPALRSIGGSKPAALDTPEKTLQACREAGVELQVSGVEEGATGLVLRRRKSSTGDVPADLKEAIRRHKTAMIARLLGDMPIDENPVRDTKPEWSRNKTLSEVWGETALHDQAKYGHRGARLYSHIDEQVWTPQGAGKLINVLGGEARVLIDRDVSRAVYAATREGKKKPKLATVDFEIGEVFPAMPAMANRRFRPARLHKKRGQRTTLHLLRRGALYVRYGRGLLCHVPRAPRRA